jgi:hypothetical protein
MKTFKGYFVIILSALLSFLFICCKKEIIKTIPTVSALAITNVTSNSATAGGKVTADGGDPVVARGVCWSPTNPKPTTAESKTSDFSGLGSFASVLSGLAPGTSYNMAAYATNAIGTAYSDVSSFKTLALAPTLTTTDLSSVTSTSFNSGGIVTNDGGSPVTARGICWSSNLNPTVSDNKTTDGSGTGNFTSSVTGLMFGTTYYIRAYATNSMGTAYGNQLATKTSNTLPTLSTTAITNITATGASGGGNITSDGGSMVTARGICWSANQNPTIADKFTVDGICIGSFTSTLTLLDPVKTYYVRAYATNMQGTAYGNQVTFTTILPLSLATVTTTAASTITATTATLGGNVTNDGNATVTERGIVYATTQNPTTSNTKLTIGTGTGNFTSNVTGLTAGTTYYFRAYAINSQGTGYGSQGTFTTILPLSLATVTTTVVSTITPTTATLGGIVTSDGNATVTDRGVVYATVQNPTTANTKLSSGTGTGSFTATVTGLMAETTYYVRSYATNSQGTAYGSELAFTTTKNTNGYLYIACEKNDYVLQYKMDGSGAIKKIGTGFVGASSLAINPSTNELFISDDMSPGVYVLRTNQTIANVGLNTDFSNPNALAFDNQGRLLVACAGSTIQRYDLAQNQNTLMGIGFYVPQGIAFYNNTIYFSDGNGYIYAIKSTETSLPVNQSDNSFRLIDTPLVAGSNGGLISDGKGKLYASDGQGKVVVVDVNNKTYESINLGNGIFNRGLALIDDQTKLLVSDYSNHRILVVNLSDKLVSVYLDHVLIDGPFGLLVSTRDFGSFQK